MSSSARSSLDGSSGRLSWFLPSDQDGDEEDGTLCLLNLTERGVSSSDLVIPEIGNPQRVVAAKGQGVPEEGQSADSSGEKKEKQGSLSFKRRRRSSIAGRPAESCEQGQVPAVLRPSRSIGSSAGSEGVLLNVYLPTLLTRSLTNTGSRTSSRRCSSVRERPTVADCDGSRLRRPEQAASVGCMPSSIWSMPKTATKVITSRSGEKTKKKVLHHSVSRQVFV